MKYHSSYITIGEYAFDCRMHSVEIEKSWKQLTSTASIKLPNMKRLIDEKRLEKVIRVGDPVLIQLGYNDQLVTEYEGYVSAVNPNVPLEIKCEDEMWQLKQQVVSMSWRSVTLREVLQFLVPTANINCPLVTLTPFRLDKVTVATALQKLKDEYLLVIYFRGSTLFAGFAYYEQGLGEVTYDIEKNCKADGLTFRKKTDHKVKVKAISILPNNTKLEYEAGDPTGNQTTLHFYNKQLSELKALAAESINRMKFDGYTGSLMAFGQPYVTHGMVANIYDEVYPEREGSYFIDSVKIKYGPEGYRKYVEVGRKSNEELLQ